MLTTAVSILSTGLKQAGGQSITYRRGNESIDITAVPVRVRHDDYSVDDDANLTARERDWIIAQEDLAMGGVRLSPERGDELDWINPFGVKLTFQVLPREGDRCFRYADSTMQILRIYTVQSLPNSE